VLEEAQRRAYGPPASSTSRHAELTGASAAPSDSPQLTEAIPDERAQEVPAASPAPPAPLGWLIVKAPLEKRGTIIPVQANQIIGREGDIRWDDSRLSRHHARVTLEPPADAPEELPVFHLWPFGTTNPVFINGQEIRGATPLHENDEIRLGDTLFVFKMLLD
jgi:hypothetical protein